MKNKQSEMLEHTSTMTYLNIRHIIDGKYCYSAFIDECPPQYYVEGLATARDLCKEDFNLSNKTVYIVTDGRVTDCYPTWATEEVIKKFMETQISHIRQHLGEFNVTDNLDKADKVIMITSLIDQRKEIISTSNDEFICKNRSLIDKSIAENKLIFVKLSI